MHEDELTNGHQPVPSGPDTAGGESQGPAFVPDHQLLRRIGRGSYGEVWLARSRMGVYRAVKIVYRKSFEHRRPFERELSGIQKFEPLSRSHEGFIDVLHVGIDEERGYFFYIMELGDDQASGQSIDPENYAPRTLSKEILLSGSLSFQECLQLGLTLSLALAELHKHGLVHRDVKPSNIIFVNGVPKLADIGLVAEVSEARSYVGTEGFIPPEGPGAPTADVYSLGKVLYEASTGKDRQDFPELPTLLDVLPDHHRLLELNEVILHACKSDAAKRYQSAWDMHADLLVLANGKSVKRLKALERRLANLKRMGGVAVLILGVLTAVGYHIYREWRVASESRQRQIGASIAYGNRALESGDTLGALPFFVDALQLDNRGDQSEMNQRLRIGTTLAQCPKLTHMWFSDRRIRDARFSPDGKRVLISRLFDKAEIYDLQTSQSVSGPFGPDIGLRSAVFSPNGRLVVTAGEDGIAIIWEVETLKVTHKLKHPGRVMSACFSPDGSQIVTACLNGEAFGWEVVSGKANSFRAKHADAVISAAFSCNGRMIVTASRDRTARIWNSGNGRAIGPPLTHDSWVNHATFSPDDQKVITSSFDREVRVWEVPSGKRIRPEMKHGDGVESAEFSPDGRLIVTASLDGTARLWLADSLLPLPANPILRHSDRLSHASFSPDSRCVLTTCEDGTVRVWDLAGSVVPPVAERLFFSADGTRYATLTNGEIRVIDVASGKAILPGMTISPEPEKFELSWDGRFAVSTTVVKPEIPSTNRLVQVWDMASGSLMAPGIVASNVSGAVLTRDAKLVAMYGGEDAQVWSVATRTPVTPVLTHAKPVRSTLFSPDGQLLVTLSEKQVRTWNATNGHPVFKPLEHQWPVEYANFCRNGNCLVVCCAGLSFEKSGARVWRLADGLPLSPELMHGDGVMFAAFSPDDSRVITAGEDFRAKVWRVNGGKLLFPPLEHPHKVRTAVFSPDGRYIITASSDKTARVWDAQTGEPLTPGFAHLGPLTEAKMLLDGQRLATRDKNNNVWIWPLSVDKRPLVELKQMVQLLSGQSSAPADVPVDSSDRLKQAWGQLRTKYPSSFSTSTQEIWAWHEYQAQQCEVTGQWTAARFHLSHLAGLKPEDGAIKQRLARANDLLAKEN